MTPETVLFLYIAFRIKHFAADFLFQSDWMALHKGQPGKEGYKALFSHVIFHAMGTMVVVMCFAPAFWWLGPLDIVVHGVIDRIKGVLTLKKGWKYTDRWFWWSFGLDQEFHNYTHLVYMIIIIMGQGGIIAD